MWEISENLHRTELTAGQRADQVAEYADLATKKREEEREISRRHDAKVGRRESGNRSPDSMARPSVLPLGVRALPAYNCRLKHLTRMDYSDTFAAGAFSFGQRARLIALRNARRVRRVLKEETMIGNFRHYVGAVAALAMLSTPAFAANLILNGDFETNGGNGELGFNTSASPWSVPPPGSSYTFVWNPGAGPSGTTADTIGADGHDGNVSLWGPGKGESNGLTLSPNGGAFIGADPAFENGALTQDVALVAGQKYTISFDWAAAQQSGFSGDTDAGWTVSIGGVALGTTDANIPSHGFSGWMSQSYSFIAAGGSETVSFLAFCSTADVNCNGGVPPFSLLDSVTLDSSVPEASTWGMMALGFAGLGFVGFRRRRVEIA
jgi:hypothetical protein